MCKYSLGSTVDLFHSVKLAASYRVFIMHGCTHVAQLAEMTYVIQCHLINTALFTLFW